MPCYRTNDDCETGLYCTSDYICQNMDECDPDNGGVNGLLECGPNTYCINTMSSFGCNCSTGYKNFIENEGCEDVDECLEGLDTCTGSRIGCVNNIGS